MLEIYNLCVSFSSYSRGLRRSTVRAIRSLDLTVGPGEIVAVVGQSGAGKSLLAHAVLGILPRNSTVSGGIVFKGAELTPERARRLRGREMALVPQSVAFLNPLLHVGSQIARAGTLGGLPPREARAAARAALERYGLPRQVYRWFPFQLSGGMARRVLAATATIGAADLLLADEPTNGLDAATARETLRHLRELADSGKAVVLITHDIELALEVADKDSVFCGGVTIEEAKADDFTQEGRLRHPYSRALWSSLPRNRFTGAVGESWAPAANGGCPHSGQCESAGQDCRERLPELIPHGAGRVRCWHA
ncbi:MAG: ATP-binding cassette domain-containing protein [Desulfovibrionaceae bacterium]